MLLLALSLAFIGISLSVLHMLNKPYRKEVE